MSSSRIVKAMKENLNVLSAAVSNHTLIAHVQGASDKYFVRIGNETAECSCPDHYHRNELCKHIMHVTATVLPNYPHIKKPCAYGIHCYRTNWNHLLEYTHNQTKKN